MDLKEGPMVASVESLILYDAIAEKCRCSNCKDYLLVSPIRGLPNGKKICGFCNPPNPDVPTTRDAVLETILKMISFPCYFRKEGCTKRLLFDQNPPHEIKCNYRTAWCFSPDKCTWAGSALPLFEHIMKEHKELLKEKAEIKLRLAEKTDGIFIFKEGSTTLVIRYLYDCDNKNFEFGMAYNLYYTDCDALPVKITLLNGSDASCAIELLPLKCPPFNKNLNILANQRVVLDLKNYDEDLKNPDSIVIVFKLTVNPILQYLDLPRCNKCCNYLIPPLFTLDNKLVCYKCGERHSDSTASNNQELSQLLKQIDFPCYWRYCSFSGKYDVYKIHQAFCKFYLHKCFLRYCERYFTLHNAVNHNETDHKAEYFVGNIIVHKISFSEEFHGYKHTMKSGVYFLLKHGLSVDEYLLMLNSTSPESITASVVLEHQHCKVNPFQLSSGNPLQILFSQLPPCFKCNEEITVTIAIDEIVITID